MRALSQVKTTFGAKVAIKSIGLEGSLERTQDKRSNKLEGVLRTNSGRWYKAIVNRYIELYRMAKKAI